MGADIRPAAAGRVGRRLLIFTVLCRPDLDKQLAARVSLWLWHLGVGHTDNHAEFYVWGDHTDAD